VSAAKSRPAISTRAAAYEGFMGLDTSRDIRAMDTGREQHLAQLLNAYCDWRGQITKDPAPIHRAGLNPVRHIRHLGANFVAWVEATGSALDLVSDRDHRLANVYPLNATPSSAIFNRRLQVAARGLPTYSYNGALWTRNTSPSLNNLGPAYLSAAQRRLVAAGILGQETKVLLSRVDNENVWPDDEPPSSPNVLRAGFIDVANLLNSADIISGVSGFEQDRLAIFTQDRCLIYRIDPDIEQWQLDERANINLGCLSHNTIEQAGTDVLFCSRNGVHTIRRSLDNGITISSFSLADKVEQLYRQLVASVPNPEDISAVYDRDERQYHVFFPQSDFLTKRLTCTLGTSDDMPPKWSLADALNARCGSALGGRLVFGTSGGVYDVQKVEALAGVAPEAIITTPILWHGSLTDIKETHSLIVQASGRGSIEVEAVDDEGREIAGLAFEIDATPDDNAFSDVPLARQYERKFEHRYRGIQFRFRLRGAGVIRMVGFAVMIRRSG
jgi:hypothetical protein